MRNLRTTEINLIKRGAMAAAMTAMLGWGALATPVTAQVLPSEDEQQSADDNWLTFGAEDGPKLTVDIEAIDLGTINDAETVKSVIPFRNTGSGLLTIDKIQTSCGCTAADLLIKDYLPGEGGEIEISYDPRGRAGAQNKMVTIQSNDRDQEATKVPLKVLIDPIVHIDSSQLSVRDHIYGEPKTVQAVFRCDWPVFEVTSVETVGSYYSAEVDRIEEVEMEDGTKERVVYVNVTIHGDAAIGYVRRNIELVCNVAKDENSEPFEYKALAKLNANIVGDLRVTPQRLNLGRISAGEEFSREFVLTSRTGREFDVLGLGIQRDPGVPLDMTHEFFENAAGQRSCRIRVAGKAPVSGGILNGVLIVTTDSEAQEEIEVSIMGSVTRPRQ